MSVNNEIDYKNTSFNWINFCYSAFIALVSIFPLLGMLGTVLALLSLDITGGATEELKANFFLALDTTAWGLVFSIAFKVANSFLQTTIETAIEKIDVLVKSHYTGKESSENEKRQINLDFTSLLDVIMIILFFFIIFSSLETDNLKKILKINSSR